ncbi:MAG TPA: PQQ-binding-like beta-propeller repeat protein [Chthoniobacteraceae bacterium]|nr:PQQ-binding-like beta-propeller repeat protein [Chthoniobacteraceae bacterium]
MCTLMMTQLLCIEAALTVGLTLLANAQDSDWPRLLGPAHNATSPETHLLHDLPKEGPRVLWQVEKGGGFGGPAVVGERLVMFFRREGREVVECLHAETGKRFWQADYEAPYQPRYGGSTGPRTSPVVADGRVFTFGISGHLHCYELASGEVRWTHDLEKEYDMGPAFFGHGSTPLVLGSRLIVQFGGRVAGKAVNTAAFDGTSGKLLWTVEHAWGGSYASPVPAMLHGRECVLVFAGGESRPPTGGLLVIDATNGAVLATAEHRAEIAESVSASSPVVVSAEPGKAVSVFVSEVYSAGGACFSIAPDFSIKRAWKNERFGLYWMTPLVRDGCLFGFAGQSERLTELVCCDATTGRELWRNDLGGGFGRGSLLAVDGGVLCLGEFGDLAWLELSRKGAAIKSRAKLFNAPETWTLPAISRGRLYVSQNERDAAGRPPRLICYDFRAP